MRDVQFRGVSDGDEIPIEDGPPDVYWPAVLRWLCPSLTAEDAREVYELGVSGLAPVDNANLRRLILDWAATK